MLAKEAGEERLRLFSFLLFESILDWRLLAASTRLGCFAMLGSVKMKIGEEAGVMVVSSFDRILTSAKKRRIEKGGEGIMVSSSSSSSLLLLLLRLLAVLLREGSEAEVEQQ